jgi:retron-type reverse transcriptase
MDLATYFDTVNHSKLIEVLGKTVKDGRVISLIHKFLNAGVMEDGGLKDTEEGVPQGGLCGAPHKEPYAEINVMRSQSRKCA